MNKYRFCFKKTNESMIFGRLSTEYSSCRSRYWLVLLLQFLHLISSHGINISFYELNTKYVFHVSTVLIILVSFIISPQVTPATSLRSHSHAKLHPPVSPCPMCVMTTKTVRMAMTRTSLSVQLVSTHFLYNNFK